MNTDVLTDKGLLKVMQNLKFDASCGTLVRSTMLRLGIVDRQAVHDAIVEEHAAQLVCANLDCRIEALRTEIKALQAGLARLESEKRVSCVESNDVLLNASNKMTILASLANQIDVAIRSMRGINCGGGGVFYALPFLVYFVLPALKGEIYEDWKNHPMWEKWVDVQMTQNLPSRYKASKTWLVILSELKSELTREQIQELVRAVCRRRRLTTQSLEKGIERFRKCLIAFSAKDNSQWVIEYTV